MLASSRPSISQLGTVFTDSSAITLYYLFSLNHGDTEKVSQKPMLAISLDVDLDLSPLPGLVLGGDRV